MQLLTWIVPISHLLFNTYPAILKNRTWGLLVQRISAALQPIFVVGTI